jgi:methyl-accepting chemotaxis protein
MNWKNLTIGKKVAVGFGVVLTLLTVVGFLSYAGVGGIVTNAGKVIDGNKLDGVLAQKEVDHLNWTGKVNALLTDNNVTELTVQTDDHQCGFGKWLYGEGRKQAETMDPSLAPLLKEIEEPHAKLHASAIEIKKHFAHADEHLPKFLVEKEVDHLKWKGKVEELFIKNLPVLKITTDDHKCGLGKFLFGEVGRKAAASDPELARLLKEIEEPHARLHATATEIQKAWKQNHPGLINTLMVRLDDHRKWTAAVATALLTNKKIGVQTDPTKCAFGKWLNSSECKNMSAKWPEFGGIIEKVSDHHDKLHATAILITDTANHSDKVRIFEKETSRELASVGRYFGALMELEEKNMQAGEHAHHIFKTETLPALADTQAALSKINQRAVDMLQGMNHARNIYATNTIPALRHVQELLGKVRQEARNNIMTDEAMLNAAQGTRRNVSIVGIVAIIGGVLLAFFIARGITNILQRISNQMGESAEQVSSASGQVSSASQSLAEGSSEQAASIEEISSSLEEMSAMTKQNAGNANQADNLMKEANQVVGQANDSMTELTVSMDEISKASEETSKIIKTIDEIAFQTNLLALNAAVEAARAGEAGAGFAVVADEVRNLAMRAADAAKNTADLIEGTVKKVKDGSDLVNTTNEAFTEVANSAAKVGELVGEIAAASNEQAQGIEQVNKAVTEMDKVVQQNAANAEESASASEEMNAQAEQMKGMVYEMVALVGGSQNGAKSVSHTGVVTPKAVTTRTLAAPEKKELVIDQAKEVRPDQVIPLDDGDFKDFQLKSSLLRNFRKRDFVV